MSGIVAQHLRKSFHGQVAVEDLSLNVKQGEVLGFLGPNGAGKTTTMRMLTGFLKPDNGTIELAGADMLASPKEGQKKLGYLPEGVPLYEEMTVTESLTFIAEARRMEPGLIRDRVEGMIDYLDMGSVRHRMTVELSKGYKRRLGLAQALIHDPDVLILDEPTDGLDPNQKHHVRGLIRDLASSKAIIISTHILEEVEAVCDRAIIIAAGKKVAEGTPAELLKLTKKKPATLETVFRQLTMKEAA